MILAQLHKKAGIAEINLEYTDFLMDFMAAGITAYFFEHSDSKDFDPDKCSRYIYRIIAREVNLPEN